jgi:hypothetical protein
MSTQFTNRQWRLPNNENKDKVSNYSMKAPNTNSRINISTPANVGITSSFSFWLKRTNNTVVTQPYRISTGTLYYGMYMSGTSTIYVRYGAGYEEFNSTATQNALALTDWVHWVITRKEVTSATQDVKLYANGNLVDSASGTSNLSTYDSEIDYLMWSLQTTDSMDSFSIFDYALSSSQVTTLYGSSSTGIGNPMALSPKPVAYYPLGDQDSFNGADYLVPNSSLKDYVFGFNGINDYIDFGNLSVFEPTSNYTFSIWFNSGSYVYKTLFGDTSNAFTQGILALLRSSDFLDYYHNTTSTYKLLTLSLTDFPINTWHNLTITWSASTGILRGFIDGKFNAQLTGVNDVDWGNISLELGRYYNTFYYDSKLSNFVMWDATLTDGFSGTPTAGDVAGGQVAEVYNNGSPQTTITGTPVGWWKLDASATFDGSNWSIPDDSSNSNNGTMYGSVATLPAALQQSDLSFTSGYSPYALAFDGANDWITVSSFMSNLPSNDIYTISTWIKTNSDTNAAWGSSNTGSALLYAYVTNGTTLGIARGSVGRVDISNALTVGEWANLVAVFDTSTNLKIYINNVFIQDVTVGSLGAVTDDFKIGGGLNAYPLDCSQSNFSIWNTALTSAQVSEIYNEGVPSNLNNHSAYSNLVSWWQLGSNTSWLDPYWIALDEKGTNNGQSQNVAAPNNMGENAIVDGVGSYANGVSVAMSDNIVGDAPYSSSNSLSVNMDVLDRVTDTPS